MNVKEDAYGSGLANPTNKWWREATYVKERVQFFQLGEEFSGATNELCFNHNWDNTMS